MISFSDCWVSLSI